MSGSRNWARIKLAAAGLILLVGALCPREPIATDEPILLHHVVACGLGMGLLLVLARMIGIKGWRNPRNMLKESPFPLSSGFICIFHFMVMIGLASAFGELVQILARTRTWSMSAMLAIVVATVFLILRTVILPVSDHEATSAIPKETTKHHI